MDTLNQVAQLVLMLSILVVLHEFGHYITAKMFKVRVEKFYLFMDAGFSLIKKKIGETEWGIGWLPLGGYVKLSGMIDESMDTEQMKSEPQPYEFRSKPAWQRLIIMLGGIIVNILLAWLIFTVVYSTYGKTYVSTEVMQKNGLVFGETGHKVGFKDGDRIVEADGKFQKSFNRMTLDVLLGDKVVVERDGKRVDVNLSDENKALILETEGRDFMHPWIKSATVDSVAPGSGAAKGGLKVGDKIRTVNGKEQRYLSQMSEEAFKHKKGFINIGIERNGQPMTLNVPVDSIGKVGINQVAEGLEHYKITEHYSFFGAIPAAITESYDLIIYNIKQFKLILRPSTGAYKQVTSVVGIATKLPTTWDWEFFWNFTALFSIGLAFMNILPIPGLDGGHAIFTIAEMITGRKLSDKAAGIVQTVGMVILLSLMALVFGKDIYQLIVG
ncbi:zinc metalloprotease [Flavobacterium akiainvivens]|uniref:Zinc metalloprotease n=1 Tax=Flavobacterium akiainvivens TaxID=1202724 RepID=A0A0M8MEI9_9FLAO|nr:RIP metalloprotease RseP [Flavobacterium akiainvivens]KOS07214.1 zinc metalloprotease [Flavobacterium akiainvivens]SFQ78346.1 regulator of sigma E protease [Flavobacterium akiainvivens]